MTTISAPSLTWSRRRTTGCSRNTSAGPDIGPHELVFGVPSYHVVNATFCHAHPLGARFNGPDRGAWYAAFELRTAQTEVGFHRSIELFEIDWRREEVATYDDYLADFSGEFHDLRRDRRFAACLAPDSYVDSQELGQRLLDAGVARSRLSERPPAAAGPASPVSAPLSWPTSVATPSTCSPSPPAGGKQSRNREASFSLKTRVFSCGAAPSPD